MNTNGIFHDVKAEMDSAMKKHSPLNSAHEAYAVILEELQEFWVEVMKKRQNRDKKAMRAELVQVAAMACRTIADLDLA
jgi:valyl-tRNA synthetase